MTKIADLETAFIRFRTETEDRFEKLEKKVGTPKKELAAMRIKAEQRHAEMMKLLMNRQQQSQLPRPTEASLVLVRVTQIVSRSVSLILLHTQQPPSPPPPAKTTVMPSPVVITSKPFEQSLTLSCDDFGFPIPPSEEELNAAKERFKSVNSEGLLQNDRGFFSGREKRLPPCDGGFGSGELQVEENYIWDLGIRFDYGNTLRTKCFWGPE